MSDIKAPTKEELKRPASSQKNTSSLLARTRMQKAARKIQMAMVDIIFHAFAVSYIVTGFQPLFASPGNEESNRQRQRRSFEGPGSSRASA